MSTESKTSSATPSAGQQRRQASILLLRLQWLLILLFIAALLWLYISQQRFQNQINERLQSNEQVVTRLNEMDDRLFAISQQSLPPPSAVVGSQAQNQLSLLRIQMQAVDRLLADSNDKAAIDLLRGLQWQLSQSSNEIAPAMTIVIKQSLVKDIERLQAQSTQPSPWQLQNIAIQNIQEFLHSHERNSSHERIDSHERVDGNKSKTNTASENMSLTRRQLTIHEVIMTLNLASQASNMREQEQLTSYLRQARNQLQTLVAGSTIISNNKTPVTNKPVINSKAGKSTATPSKPSTSAAKNKNSVATMEAPSNITEVIAWLDKLIANAPKPTPLLITQILESPKN